MESITDIQERTAKLLGYSFKVTRSQIGSDNDYEEVFSPDAELLIICEKGWGLRHPRVGAHMLNNYGIIPGGK